MMRSTSLMMPDPEAAEPEAGGRMRGSSELQSCYDQTASSLATLAAAWERKAADFRRQEHELTQLRAAHERLKSGLAAAMTGQDTLRHRQRELEIALRESLARLAGATFEAQHEMVNLGVGVRNDGAVEWWSGGTSAPGAEAASEPDLQAGLRACCERTASTLAAARSALQLAANERRQLEKALHSARAELRQEAETDKKELARLRGELAVLAHNYERARKELDAAHGAARDTARQISSLLGGMKELVPADAA